MDQSTLCVEGCNAGHDDDGAEEPCCVLTLALVYRVDRVRCVSDDDDSCHCEAFVVDLSSG